MFSSGVAALRRGVGVACLVTAMCALVPVASAQTPKLDWRRIGNTAMDASLAGVATGPVDRVWYSEDGARLFARTASGRIFATTDYETWTAAEGIQAPTPAGARATRRPETTAKLTRANASSPRVYAVGRFAYRSDDDGSTWTNLTALKNESIVGDGVADLAVSPRNPDEVTVASQAGVWRSVDGGLSWTGLNDALPNLPIRRILGAPDGIRGMRVAMADASAWEWSPGEKHAWASYSDRDFSVENDLRGALSIRLQATITAVAVSGDAVYAGSAAGSLWASADRGRTWTKSPDAFAGPVNRIWVDSREPRLALAALGAPRPDAQPSAKQARVLRTVNGGAFWDDLTAALPDGGVNGVAGDRATGAVYAATDRGLFMTYGDLVNAGPATAWTQVAADLPEAAATDVVLDAAGNQLYAAFDGYGVYGALAPHRLRDPKVVSAADFAARAAAPGALISILGANVRAATAGAVAAPVLAGGDARTDIQVPFDATGTSIPLSFETPDGARTVGIPLRPTSPAIFVDRDGAPMLLDGDSGMMLDAMTPARSNGRVQILATGLGRVNPDLPAGVPAPADTPFRVTARVRAYLDREPVEVTRAVLAPGYVGFYLVEVELPKIVNYGPAELYIEADGQPSNRVRVYIQP